MYRQWWHTDHSLSRPKPCANSSSTASPSFLFTSATSRAMNTSCIKSIYCMLEHLGQLGHLCPDYPQQKQTTTVEPGACAGVLTLTRDGLEAITIGGAYHNGGFVILVGAQGNMLPVIEGFSWCGDKCKDVLKASFAMQFLSQSLAAAYHSHGTLSDSCPLVRQAM